MDEKWAPGYREAELDGAPPPHGWIQWKGTDVCIDIRCVCGASGHFDAEFLYHIKCSRCGRKYEVGCVVKLYEHSEESAKRVEARPGGFTWPTFGGPDD